ncbi:MAG TPA: serine hydrolase, partial [Pedobacter sp.]
MAKRILFCVFVIISFQNLRAQINRKSSLFTELKKQDSVFFERGFNQCDIAFLEMTTAEDLKFFHDQSGFQDRTKFLENTRKFICSDPDKKPIRKLAEESLNVYPLYSNGALYGAIQHGTHHFYLREIGKEDQLTSTARFTHVWRLQNNSWKLSEVLSYDHQAPIETINVPNIKAKKNDDHLEIIKSINPTHVKSKISLVENSLKEIASLSNDSAKKYNIIDRMKLHKIPSVSIAVINNGKVEWAKAYGYADIAHKKPADAKTIYQIASITKSINAFYIMKLAQEAKLSLDTDIRAYLKTWKISENEFSREKKITLRNLLSHTAGFGTGGFGGYLKSEKIPTINQILNGEQPANNEPVKLILPVNERFSYSGGGTTITRKIIEDNISPKYDSLLQTDILKPLRMTNSTFQQVLPIGLKNFAKAYDGGIKEVPGDYAVYPELAADGLWSTPTDMAKFIISIQQSLANKSGNLLNKDSAIEMLTPVLNTTDIALGAFIIERGGEKYFTHLGGNRGFQSIYYGSFTTGQGIVILTNTDNAHPNLIKEIVNSVAAV